MDELERREELAEEEVDTAPIYIGGDDEAPTAELEVLDGEVVEPRGAGSLVLAEPLPRDRHPVLVYLASLSEGSRRTMRASLENIARFISGGEAGALTLAWHELRYQHTAFIRATLAQAYKPATANKMLSALREVLKECFRLGNMSAQDYQRARLRSRNWGAPGEGRQGPKGQDHLRFGWRGRGDRGLGKDTR